MVPLLITFLSLSLALSTTTPVAFECSASPESNASNASFLTRATMISSKTGFTKTTISVVSHNITCLLQCRQDIDHKACFHCLMLAMQSLSSLRKNTTVASIWFNGCHLSYYWQPSTTKLSHNKSVACNRTATRTVIFESEDDMSLQARVVVVVGWWLAGVVCMIGVVVGTWVLRRRILSAKVGNFAGEDA